jgi:hypothetical protein
VVPDAGVRCYGGGSLDQENGKETFREPLPAITPTTLLAIEKAEAIAQRGLTFAELSHVEAEAP